MNKLSKKQVLAVSAMTVITTGVLGVGGIFGLSKVKAADDTSDYPLIIQNLVEAFGLNAEDVEAVFEETRDERQGAYLDQYVEDGTITEEQKTLILEKHDEMRAAMDDINNQSLTAEERRDALQSHHDEMETWAEENGIPTEVLRPGRGGMGGFGEGMGDGDMMRGGQGGRGGMMGF